MAEHNELEELNRQNQLLNKKLMEQYAINNQLQKQLGKNKKFDDKQLNSVKGKKLDDQHYDFENDDGKQSELEPLSLSVKQPSAHSQHSESAVDINPDCVQKIKPGTITVNLCKCYALRIYSHYWIWQIPVLITNIVLCWILVSHRDLNTELSFLAVGPVFFATLIRDKMFCWMVYTCVKLLRCCTQYQRYHFSRLADCIGGLHASFGVTAYLWNAIYFYHVVISENYQLNGITATAFLLPTLLLIICMSAVPCFRYYYHNSFELVHRYLNWLSLNVLILHVYFVNNKVLNEFSGLAFFVHLMYNTPSLFTMGLVILTLYPWVIIHKIKGTNVEIIPSKSGMSVALLFPIWSPMGAVCKLSTNWTEFHVMGITPLSYNKETDAYQSLVLVKSLGDWSTALTEKAKNEELNDTNFWIHRIKPPNFSQGLFNWKKVFALATGAGIAPLIPYVVHPEYWAVEISLVWVARDHFNNYPQFIVDILKPLPNVVLYDTTKQKRLDLAELTVKKAKQFDAEAVFIVSNPEVAYNVATCVAKHGIPVFASNFDV